MGYDEVSDESGRSLPVDNSRDEEFRPPRSETPGPTVVSFSVASQRVVERAQTIEVEITVAPPSTSPLELVINVGGTASAGVDYEASLGVVTVPANTASSRVSVQILDDNAPETEETLTLSLAPSDAYVLGSVPSHAVALWEPFVRPMYPLNGANWNDYVANARGPAVLTAADEPCTPPSSAVPLVPPDCGHGGELRAATVPGLTSCVGVSVSDALNAFEWRCSDAGGDVFVYSTALRNETRLSSLINEDGWLENRIEISTPIGVLPSDPATWWSNPVRPVPVNNGSGTELLDEAGVIYFSSGDLMTDGYRLTGDGAAFVLSEGSQVLFSGTGLGPLLRASGVDFLWFEADWQANNAGTRANSGLSLVSSYYSTIRHMVGRESAVEGISVLFGGYNRIEDVRLERAATNEGSGLLVTTSNFNRVRRLRVRGHRESLYLRTANRNSLSEVQIDSSGNYALLLFGSHGNVYANVRVANPQTYGMDTYRTELSYGTVMSRVLVTGAGWDGLNNDQGQNGTYTHLLLANNGDHGLYLGRSNTARNNVYNSMVAVNNGDEGVRVASTTDSDNVLSNVVSYGNDGGLYVNGNATLFRENLLIGGNLRNTCVVPNASAGLENGSCDTRNGSDAVVRDGIELNTSFVGKSLVADAVNSAGVTDLPASSIADAFAFENDARLWARSGGRFPALDQHGRCVSSTTCSVWDWRLRASDTYLLNRSGMVPGDNSPFVADGPCPAAVQGDRTLTDQNGLEIHGDGVGNDNFVCEIDESCEAPNTFLSSALELIDDDVGDDDGLCESEEACLYAPNIGYYQGSGDYTRTTCVFQDGIGPNAVAGVTMYAHPVNGVGPNVTVLEPMGYARANQFNQGSFAMSGRCTEAGQAVVLSGAASASTTCTDNLFSFDLNLSGLGDGTLPLTITHASSDTPIDVIKDTVGAGVSIENLSDALVDSSNYVQFRVHGTCTSTPDWVYLSGDVSSSVRCSGGRFQMFVDLTSVADGTLNFQVSHDDLAQNGSATDSIVLEKNLLGPSRYSGAGCTHPPCTIATGRGGSDFVAGTDVNTVVGIAGPVSFAELNEDGALDLVALNGGQLLVYIGDGTGDFSAQSPINLVADGVDLALGDLNGDDHVDVVVGTASGFSVYTGAGDGTLSLSGGVASAASARALALGDVSSDGELDAIVTYSADETLVHLGNGSAGFAAGTIVDSRLDGSDVALRDLDEDGHLDLLRVIASELFLSVGDGSGGFALASSLLTDVSAVEVAFLGRDRQRPDIIALPANGAELRYLLGNNSGFDGARNVGGGAGAQAVCPGGIANNFNESGDLVVLYGSAGPSDSFYSTNNSGRTGDAALLSADTLDSTACTVGDVDNDRRLDVLVASNNGRLRLYRGAP